MADYEIILDPLPKRVRQGRALRLAGRVRNKGEGLPGSKGEMSPLSVGLEVRTGASGKVERAARFVIGASGLATGETFPFSFMLDTASFDPGPARVLVDLLYEGVGWLRHEGGIATRATLSLVAPAQFSRANVHRIGVKGDSEFEALLGGLRFACQFEALPGSDRLIVSLRGVARQDEGERPPVFMVWPRAFAGRANILRISDPTLFLSDQLRLGSFFGREDANPIDGVLEIAAAIADKLDVPSEKILFFGVSGGGMASLMCATRFRGSAALAVNPQIEARHFANATFARHIAEIFRPGADLNWMADTYPRRASVTAAVGAAVAQGYVPRLTLLQNVTDVRHYNEHFAEFLPAFGAPATGGTDPTGRLRGIAYDKEGGHATMPDEEQVIAEAELLLGVVPAEENGGPTRT